MEIRYTNFTREEKLKVVYDCLCTGLPFFGAYGLALDYDSKQYDHAKANLKKNNPDMVICLEDVQTEMVRMGYDLVFYDMEDDGAEAGRLNLKAIEGNWGEIRPDDITAWTQESYDAADADNIMQCIVFGKIVYG